MPEVLQRRRSSNNSIFYRAPVLPTSDKGQDEQAYSVGQSCVECPKCFVSSLAIPQLVPLDIGLLDPGCKRGQSLFEVGCLV